MSLLLQGGARCALVSCAAVSAQGGAAVLVDTHGQLHVYRLPQVWPDLLRECSLPHYYYFQ